MLADPVAGRFARIAGEVASGNERICLPTQRLYEGASERHRSRPQTAIGGHRPPHSVGPSRPLAR